MSKTLILGGNGFLGSAFRLLNDKVILHQRKLPTNKCDEFVVFNPWDIKVLEDFVVKNDIRRIINCIALANIDYCEKNERVAFQVNSKLPELLSKLCFKHNIHFTHISTDAVFDGKLGNYSEASRTNPISVYGRSKLNGELSVLENNPKSFIARVNFYGVSPKRNSLFDFFYNSILSKSKVPGFDDVIFSPLYIKDLVRALFSISNLNYSGVLHMASDNPLSKYSFGVLIAKLLGEPADIVEKKILDVLDPLNIRAKNLSLDNKKFRGLYKQKFDLESGILDSINIRKQVSNCE